MSDERQRYAAAWKDRRRRMLSWHLGAPVLLIGGPMLSAHLLEGRLPPLSDMTARMSLVLAVAFFWIGSYAVVGIWLNRFRCPRCRGFYYWKWTWPPDWRRRAERQQNWRDCRHCGLHQDEFPPEAARTN